MTATTVIIRGVENQASPADHYFVGRPVVFQGSLDTYLGQTRDLGCRPLSADELHGVAGKVEGLRGVLLGWEARDRQVFFECVEEHRG